MHFFHIYYIKSNFYSKEIIFHNIKSDKVLNIGQINIKKLFLLKKIITKDI